MFESFTSAARDVVTRAESEARALGHNYVGTEHLLLGLIAREGRAAQALSALGVDAARIRAQIGEIIGRGKHEPDRGIPFTPRAKKVLDLARREGLQLGHTHVGTEDILLGLIREGEGVGAQVLVQLGVGLNDVRRMVIRLDSGGTAVPSGGRAEQLQDELRGVFAENERLHREVARLTDLLRRNGIEPD